MKIQKFKFTSTLHENPNYDRTIRVFALCYSIVLLFFNFLRIFEYNVWGDEVFTINVSKMGIKESLYVMSHDVHPPLYHLITLFVYRLFGDSVWLYHFISYIPYLLVIIFSLSVIWKKMGKMPSLFLITFISFMRNALVNNNEVRMYSWAACFVLLAFYELFCILKSGMKIHFFLFCVYSICAAYTHYYALISVAFIYIFLLFWSLHQKKYTCRVIILYITAIVSYIPWLYMCLSPLAETTEDYWIKTSISFTTGILYFFDSSHLVFSWTLLVIFIITTVYIVLRDTHTISIFNETECYDITLNSPSSIDDVYSLMCLCGFLSALWTLLIGEMISLFVTPCLLARYLYPITPVIWLSFGIALTRIKKGNIIAVLLCIFVFGVGTQQYTQIYQAEKNTDKIFLSTLETMNEYIIEDDVLLTNGNHLYGGELTYYFPEATIISAPSRIHELESTHNYWLVWTNELRDFELGWLDEIGYDAHEIYANGIIGNETIYFYKLEARSN